MRRRLAALLRFVPGLRLVDDQQRLQTAAWQVCERRQYLASLDLRVRKLGLAGAAAAAARAAPGRAQRGASTH